MLTLAKIFLVALLGSLLLTPLVRSLALRWGMVDEPDEHRKLQASAISLGGGVAVLGGFAAALAVAFVYSSRWRERFAADWLFLTGLLAAAGIICFLGCVDDRYGLRGRQKLLGQLVATTVLACSGLVIERFTIFGWQIELGLLAVPFTLFWLLGATNALNLIDGVDGLATSVGIVLSLAVSVMSLLAGHTADALLAMAAAGSLAGFLVYNAPPASIFLGDAGSMFIGLVLGALAIRSSLKGPATIALAAPTALLAIPIFDVTMAIVRRTLTGRSIYSADRGHLHHRLILRGYGPRSTVLVIGLLCALTAVGAVFSEYAQNDVLAILAILAVVAVLALTRLFGHQEFVLLVRRTKHFVRSLVPHRSRPGERRGELQTLLQGSPQWVDLWHTLTEYAERFDLSSIQLNVLMPAWGQEYHASWNRKELSADADLWHSDIPLMADTVRVGRLRIAGRCGNGSVCTWMADLIAGLKPFETQMLELIDAEDTPEPAVSPTRVVPTTSETEVGQPQ